jgi:hypothetical protein
MPPQFVVVVNKTSLRGPALQESKVAQASRGFRDRGLGGTRPPAEHALRPFVVDDQIGQLSSWRFLGRYPLRERAEPVAQDPGQLQPADRRTVGEYQEALAGRRSAAIS